MEITGRVTAKAEVASVKGDKKVVRFTVAINDSYRMGEERREITNYFDCAYFRNEGIAEYLNKGAVVQIFGRVGVNAYIGKDGEAKGRLTFHVSEIKLFGGNGSSSSTARAAQVAEFSVGEQSNGVAKKDEETDDLPF